MNKYALNIDTKQLEKKKDVNKSDAILIARFFAETRLKDNK